MTGPAYLGHLPHDETAVDLLTRGASITDRVLRRRPFVEVAVGLAAAVSDLSPCGGGAVNVERIGLVDEPGQLAELIRREYGAQLPAASPRESHREREARQEKTKWVLENEVMPRVNEARIRVSNPALSLEVEDLVVELVLSAMFLLPHVLGILEREPLAEDLVVYGGDPTRLDLADGTTREYPPLVSDDPALERVISNVAQDHHRPFSFESPTVDVQLSPRLRFHGQGFDVVSRPAIFIRVHRALGAGIADLFEAGTMSAGLAYLLGTVVPRARLSVLVSGVQGAGKTTVLRALALAYPPGTRMVTVETDFELGLVGLGRRWVQEMQARLPVTSKDRGITCGDLMPATLRTRADVILVGEVRGDEGAAAIRAANIGQGRWQRCTATRPTPGWSSSSTGSASTAHRRRSRDAWCTRRSTWSCSATWTRTGCGGSARSSTRCWRVTSRRSTPCTSRPNAAPICGLGRRRRCGRPGCCARSG